MKIVRNNKLYVSKRDLVLLMGVAEDMPISIKNKLLISNDEYLMFDDCIDVLYLNNIYWILDYEKTCMMSLSELNEILRRVKINLERLDNTNYFKYNMLLNMFDDLSCIIDEKSNILKKHLIQ